MRLRHSWLILLGAGLLFGNGVMAQDGGGKAEAGGAQKTEKPKKPRRRPNPALKPVDDVAGLPRVLLIGDSISIGYTIPTRKKLDGKANVHRIPTNGGPTIRGVSAIDSWLGDGRWDVIHFNWGLHDLKRMPDGKHQVPIEEYKANLEKLVARLKQTGATLIWASTTPVPEGDLKPPRSNADVQAYNRVAKEIMDANGIAVDDLYSFAEPRLADIQLPVNVHFTAAGYAKLAEAVAGSIEQALAQR
jgi:acyl-CoA thioesterase-1